MAKATSKELKSPRLIIKTAKHHPGLPALRLNDEDRSVLSNFLKSEAGKRILDTHNQYKPSLFPKLTASLGADVMMLAANNCTYQAQGWDSFYATLFKLVDPVELPKKMSGELPVEYPDLSL